MSTRLSASIQSFLERSANFNGPHTSSDGALVVFMARAWVSRASPFFAGSFSNRCQGGQRLVGRAPVIYNDLIGRLSRSLQGSFFKNSRSCPTSKASGRFAFHDPMNLTRYPLATSTPYIVDSRTDSTMNSTEVISCRDRRNSPSMVDA